MHNKRSHHIVIFVWILVFPIFSLFTQEMNSDIQEIQQEKYNSTTIHHNKLDRKVWKKTTKNMRFEDFKEKPKKEKQWNPNKVPSSPSINPQFMQIFFYSIIIILFLGVLYYLVKSGFLGFSRNPLAQQEMDIRLLDEEEIDAPLDKYLKEALLAQNYKLAIRIYYLKVLKQLQELGKINWKKYKTNRHYLNEMLQDHNFQLFKDVTVHFEKNWFGPDETTKDAFAEIEPNFIQLLRTLDSKS